jgi:hypothetical protein
MVNQVELVGDGNGVVVVGKKAVVTRFLKHSGLHVMAEQFDLSGMGRFLQTGSDAAKIAANAYEQSAMYLKLTPESAERLKEAGALMKTKDKGISHAMLGEPGKKSMKWLQVQDAPSALVTNPAILSGLGGVMALFAEQAEAQELKDLLVRIDEKLDDVLRAQRDELIAKLKSAESQLSSSIIQLNYNGDPQTIWDKINGANGGISDVQDLALKKLETLADKVDAKQKAGTLKKAMKEVEGDVALYLSVLAKCFELQNQFNEIELHKVFVTAPDRFDDHRLGLTKARDGRRRKVLDRTTCVMDRMNAAAGVAEANVLLHAPAARAVIASLNATAEAVDEFHVPLGIEPQHGEITLTPWRRALRDPEKRHVAAKEAGQKTVPVVTAAAGLVAMVFVNQKRS